MSARLLDVPKTFTEHSLIQASSIFKMFKKLFYKIFILVFDCGRTSKHGCIFWINFTPFLQYCGRWKVKKCKKFLTKTCKF